MEYIVPYSKSHAFSFPLLHKTEHLPHAPGDAYCVVTQWPSIRSLDLPDLKRSLGTSKFVCAPFLDIFLAWEYITIISQNLYNYIGLGLLFNWLKANQHPGNLYVYATECFFSFYPYSSQVSFLQDPQFCALQLDVGIVSPCIHIHYHIMSKWMVSRLYGTFHETSNLWRFSAPWGNVCTGTGHPHVSIGAFWGYEVFQISSRNPCTGIVRHLSELFFHGLEVRF